MKLYTEEDLIKAIAFGFGVCHKENRAPFNTEMKEFIGSLEPTKKIELPSNEEIEKHINYLKTCRQNLIDNANNMPQHLLEGGCMAFESAIDNANELFLGGNK